MCVCVCVCVCVCSLGKPLRSALRLCGEVDISDGCAAAVSDLLHHGLEVVLGGSPCNYSYHKLVSKWSLGVYLKVRRAGIESE